jgi:hypothetical protein
MPEKSFLDRAAEYSLRNGNALEAIPRNSTSPSNCCDFAPGAAHKDNRGLRYLFEDGLPFATLLYVLGWVQANRCRARIGKKECISIASDLERVQTESSGLPSARVELSAVRELTIGPFAALGVNGRCCRGRVSLRIPIRRSRMNPPDIAQFVECQAHYPALASHSQGHTVGDASRNTFATGELVEAHGLSGLQRTRNPYAATLGIYHQGVARLGEWGFCIDSGNTKRDLGADSSAASSCF